MINCYLLRQTLCYIESHPEEYSPSFFHYGQEADFFSHAALLSGARWADADPYCDQIISPASGIRYHVYEWGKRVLGLDRFQAMGISEEENGLAELRAYVNGLCDG